MITQYDIEYLLIFVILGILFLKGLKPNIGGQFRPFVIDKTMSQALKGIACVFILMGHWGQRKFDMDMPWGISKVVWQTTATTALVWFMFFSGYGMSLKRIKQGDYLSSWWKSMKKIFIPCLLTCFVFLLVCSILPNSYTYEEAKSLWLPKEIHLIHNLNIEACKTLAWSLMGNRDWYVCCILMFYTIYYVITYLSDKFQKNQTILLSIAFVIYWFWAYWYFGVEQGHYFRFVWTFMFGHAVAKRTKISWIMTAILMIPIILESKVVMLNFTIGIAVLYLLSFINSRYEMKGKAVLFMGTISYFFYLAHVRLGYTLLTYTGINSIFFWIAITTIISYLLYKLNSKIKYDNIKKRIKVLSQGR